MLASRGGARTPCVRVLAILFMSTLQCHIQAAANNTTNTTPMLAIDSQYPGTAVGRMLAARARASSLSTRDLSDKWPEVRRKILWAAGLKDITTTKVGYTGHSFNDWNHVDATCMLGSVIHEENDGRVEGIAQRNPLGDGIQIASIPELGVGGSWSTCSLGAHHDPPQDVAHIQFQSRIAFKLVWCVPDYTQFVLVDDDGALLTWGEPSGVLPALRERQRNYQHLLGSKYVAEAFQRRNITHEQGQSGPHSDL